MKICIKCSNVKNLDKFSKRDCGYRNICKDCHNAQKLEWTRQNRARRAEISHNSYAKSIGKTPGACRGKIGSADWLARKLPNKSSYYSRHREEVLERVKQRAQEKKSEIREYSLRWRNINIDKKSRSDKVWRSNNPDLVAFYSNTRRARKLQAQPAWLTAIHKAQIREMYDIAQIKYMQTGTRYHVDHIFPLKGENFCGLHVPWNLQVLTRDENHKKHLSVPHEFSHMIFEAA